MSEDMEDEMEEDEMEEDEMEEEDPVDHHFAKCSVPVHVLKHALGHDKFTDYESTQQGLREPK